MGYLKSRLDSNTLSHRVATCAADPTISQVCPLKDSGQSSHVSMNDFARQSRQVMHAF